MAGYLEEIHPVLPVYDLKKALRFYVEKLDFKILFADHSENPYYAGIVKDNIQIHLQWHDIKEWHTIERPSLRILVKNIKQLYKTFQSRNVFHEHTKLTETNWNTLEFAFFDPFKNGLTFYCNI